MYSSFPFAIAAASVEIPYLIVQALVFCPITFFLVGFSNEEGWEFWYFTLLVLLTIAMYTFMGQLLACALSPTLPLCQVIKFWFSNAFFGRYVKC